MLHFSIYFFFNHAIAAAHSSAIASMRATPDLEMSFRDPKAALHITS